MFYIGNMDCEFLFLTGLFPKETEKEILENSIGLPQHAANNLQWNFVEGFTQNNVPITLYNLAYVGSYPKRYKKAFVKDYNFSHDGLTTDKNIGFCNLSVIKRFSRAHNAKRNIKKWILANKGKRMVIFAYAMTDTFDSALAYAKKIDKSVKTCLIVPDLPQFMNTNSKRSLLYSLLKPIDTNKQYKLAKKIDSFVFLTKSMATFFPKKPFIVIEGIATSQNVLSSCPDDWKGKKKILYAGALKRKYGVLFLVNAFKHLDFKKYVLIICGEGECKNEIIDEHNANDSIVFMGSVSHDRVLELETISDVLVNPRMEDGEDYTKYSFPSKILEYISNKKPVVCYKLKGIPSEYDSLLFYPDNYSEESFARKIEEAATMNDNEKDDYEQQAVNFIKTKSPLAQVKKMIDFVAGDRTN